MLKLITRLLSLVEVSYLRNDFLFEAIHSGTFPPVLWTVGPWRSVPACAVPGTGEQAPVLGWERRHWSGNVPAAAKERSDSACSSSSLLFFPQLLKRALVQVSPEGNSKKIWLHTLNRQGKFIGCATHFMRLRTFGGTGTKYCEVH